MGVDLVPRNKSVKPFSTNWIGWRKIAEFLGENLPMENNGTYIKAKTAKCWSEEIKEALKDIRDEEIFADLLERFSDFCAECRGFWVW